MTGLLLLVGLPLLVVLACVYFSRRVSWEAEYAYRLGAAAAGLFLLVSLLDLGLTHLNAPATVAEVESHRADLAASRERGATWEIAAIQTRVQEINAEIAAWRYWNGTVLDYWTPDTLAALDPIR